MLPRSHPDRIQVAFDDHRCVSRAGGNPDRRLLSIHASDDKWSLFAPN